MLDQVLASSVHLPLAKVNNSQGLTDSKLLFHTAMSVNVYLLAVCDKQAHNATAFPCLSSRMSPPEEVFLGFLQHAAAMGIDAPSGVLAALFKRHRAEQ